MGMTDKEKVFKFIEGSTQGVVELESLLTAIPAMAPESEGIGEIEKAKALEAWLRKHGIDKIEHFDSKDERVPSKLRPNMVATIPGVKDDRRIWIMSHLDVVPEGDRSTWKTDPFKVEVKSGVLYGRGVEDNQQGLASSVFAVLALLDSKIVPAHTVKLLFVADEEVGSVHGIQYLLKHEKLFRKDDLILVPDGGCSAGTDIEVAEKHICWMKISTKGKQTHASMPDQGSNAFLAACDLAVRIHSLEKEVFNARDPLFAPDRSTIHPTKKEANVPNVNTIPGDDVFYVDMRILPTYRLEAVIAEVEKKMRAIEKEYNVKVSYELLQSHESKATPADAPVVRLLGEAIREVYKVEPKAIGIGGGSVAAYLRNAGYDSVVWAKQDETAHQPNESAKLENILGDAKVFASLMLRE
jgi:succinyl-diaminopimelate desuccinylase